MAVDEAAEDECEGPEEVSAGDDAAKEEEEARVPRTKKPPVGMTAAEWQTHCLTHLPYNPACRCCVAGRKRDDPHRRRTTGSADINTEGKDSICADYFFPKDAPGKGRSHSDSCVRPPNRMASWPRCQQQGVRNPRWSRTSLERLTTNGTPRKDCG